MKSLTVMLGLESKAFIAGIRAAQQSVGRIATSTDKLSSSLQSMKRIAMIAFAGWGVKELGASFIEAANKYQRFSATLGAATGDARGSFKFLREESERLGIQFEKQIQDFSQLAAAARGTAIQGEGLKKVFTGIVTAGTVLQLSAQKQALAIYAVQQMLSKGTVTAEELKRQLGDVLPGAFQVAMRAMGKTREQLTKLMETGQLVSDEFVTKFADRLIKEYGPAVETAAKTFARNLDRMKNYWFDFRKAFMEAGVFEAMSEALEKLTKKINEMRLSGELVEWAKTVALVFGETMRIAAWGVYLLVQAIGKLRAGFKWLKLEVLEGDLKNVKKEIKDIEDAISSMDAHKLEIVGKDEARKLADMLEDLHELKRRLIESEELFGKNFAAVAGPAQHIANQQIADLEQRIKKSQELLQKWGADQLATLTEEYGELKTKQTLFNKDLADSLGIHEKISESFAQMDAAMAKFGRTLSELEVKMPEPFKGEIFPVGVPNERTMTALENMVKKQTIIYRKLRLDIAKGEEDAFQAGLQRIDEEYKVYKEFIHNKEFLSRGYWARIETLELEVAKKRLKAYEGVLKDIDEKDKQYFEIKKKILDIEVDEEYRTLKKLGVDVDALERWALARYREYYEEKLLATGTFVDGVMVAMDQMARELITTAEMGKEAWDNFVNDTTDAFSDILYSGLKGDMEGINDAWNSLMNSMLRNFTNTISQMAINMALFGNVQGMAGGISGGILGGISGGGGGGGILGNIIGSAAGRAGSGFLSGAFGGATLADIGIGALPSYGIGSTFTGLGGASATGLGGAIGGIGLGTAALGAGAIAALAGYLIMKNQSHANYGMVGPTAGAFDTSLLPSLSGFQFGDFGPAIAGRPGVKHLDIGASKELADSVNTGAQAIADSFNSTMASLIPFLGESFGDSIEGTIVEFKAKYKSGFEGFSVSDRGDLQSQLAVILKHINTQLWDAFIPLIEAGATSFISDFNASDIGGKMGAGFGDIAALIGGGAAGFGSQEEYLTALGEFLTLANLAKNSWEGINQTIDEALNPLSEWEQALRGINTQFDGWIKTLKDLGFSEEALAEIEEKRADVIERLKGDMITDIITNIEDMVNPLSEWEQVLREINDQFDGWIKTLRELGYTEEQIAEIEAKRAIAIQNVIKALEEEAVEMAAWAAAEKIKIQDTLESDLDRIRITAEKQIDAWYALIGAVSFATLGRSASIGDYQTRFSDIGQRISGLDPNRSDYNDQLLSLFKDQFDILQQIRDLTAREVAQNEQSIDSIDRMLSEVTFGSLASVQSASAFGIEMSSLLAAAMGGGLEDVTAAIGFIPQFLQFMGSYGEDYNILTSQMIQRLDDLKNEYTGRNLSLEGTMLSIGDQTNSLLSVIIAKADVQIAAINQNAAAQASAASAAAAAANAAVNAAAQLTPEMAAAKYLQQNPDVSTHYSRDPGAVRGATGVADIIEWAAWHYQKWGQSEGRIWPTTLQHGGLTSGFDLVGESGPEFLISRPGSQVVSSADSIHMIEDAVMGGILASGMGGPIIIQIDGREVARVNAKYGQQMRM